MNKTININLGGSFFHIDEIAYKKLRKYLDAIRKSLSDDPKGKDEILTDIESRIGEILSEKVQDLRQVVNEQNIDDIVVIMGKPEDYIGDEEYFEENTNKPHTNKSTKKLYRDTTDKFLGGVSSGLAHYFGFDVIWVRIAWLFLAFGTVGIPIYIVLWILLPQAHSTAEKLEMEGEAVNISNIEKKIRHEFSKASQIMKDGVDDVSNHLKKSDYQGKVKSGSQEIVNLFGRIFSVLFKIVGKFIGIILLFIAGITLFSLIIALFTAGSADFLNVSNNFIHFPDFFLQSTFPLWLLTLFLVVAIGIPFVVLFKLGLRIISKNTKPFSRTVSLTLLGVWLISLLGFVFVVIDKGARFANQAKVLETVDVIIDQSKTLNVKMITKDDFVLSRDSFDQVKVFENNNQMLYGTNISFDIKESENDKIELKIYKKSSGISYEVAKEKATAIDYDFKIVDNNLILNAFYLNEIKNKYSNQKIKLVLSIPIGTKVYLHKSTKLFLYYVDNIQDLSDRKMANHYFIMTDKGLDCLDCNTKSKKKIINNDDILNKKIQAQDSLKIQNVKKINKHVIENENGLEIN